MGKYDNNEALKNARFESTDSMMSRHGLRNGNVIKFISSMKFDDICTQGIQVGLNISALYLFILSNQSFFLSPHPL